MQYLQWPGLLLAALVLVACGENKPPVSAPGPTAASKPPISAPGPADAGKPASAASAGKAECSAVESCVQAMLAAADPFDKAALSQAESNLRKLNKATKGDGAKARELFEKGRAELKKGNRPVALDLLRQAATADPADSEILDTLAITNIHSNDLVAARKAIYLGLSVDPAYAELWNSLSLLLTISGTKDDAVRALLVAYHYEKDSKATLAQWEGNLGAMRGDSKDVFSTAIAKLKGAGNAK